jgi:hypothetical protein
VQARAFDDVYELEGVEEMLDAVVAFTGEDGRDRSSGALARPVRGERAYWRALALCWARLAWPMPCSREPGLCRVISLVLCRCSRTR